MSLFCFLQKDHGSFCCISMEKPYRSITKRADFKNIIYIIRRYSCGPDIIGMRTHGKKRNGWIWIQC